MLKIEDYTLTPEEEDEAMESYLKACDEEDERLKKRIKMLELKKTNRRRFQEKARDFYDERKEWIKQGVSVARDYEDCNQDKVGKERELEKVRKRAKVYDEEFLFYFDSPPEKILEFHSLLKIAEFEIANKEYPSVKASLKTEKINYEEQKMKKKSERFSNALQAGAVPAERNLGHVLFWQKGGMREEIEICGNLDYKMLWILSAVGRKFLLAVHKNEIEEKKVINKTALESNVDLFMAKVEKAEERWKSEIMNFRNYIIDIPLTLQEFKKIIGRNISNKEFYNKAKELGRVMINGKIQFYDIEKAEVSNGKHAISEIKTTKEMELPLVSVELTTTERKLRGQGAGNKECKIRLWFWNRHGLAYLSNLYAGYLDLLPRRFFSEVSGYAQTLFQSIAWLPPPVILSVKEISNILGLKDVELIARIGRRIKSIERILNELKEYRYLQFWEEKGKGRKTRFVLYKPKYAKWYLTAKKELTSYAEKNSSAEEVKIREKIKKDAIWAKELTAKFRSR